MISNRNRMLLALLASALMFTFIIGLAYSISTGFAGFWGGLPFTCIVIVVLSMASYDFWDECVRKKK